MTTLNLVIGLANLFTALLVAIACGITLQSRAVRSGVTRFAARCFLGWSVLVAGAGLLALWLPLERLPWLAMILLLAPLLYGLAAVQVARGAPRV